MTVGLEDVHGRLASFGLTQVDTRAGVGTEWEGDMGRFVVSDNVQDALDTLRTVEVLAAGSEVKTGYSQAIEMLTLLADSRERYRGGPEEMDRAIASEVNAMRNAIKVLQGERYTAYGVMHSFDWEKFESLAEIQGLELTGEPLD